MNTVIQFSKNLLHFARFSLGYCYYKIRKVTPSGAYLSMRQLYCATNGKFNNSVARFENMFKKNYPLDNVNGILGKLDHSDVVSISEQIEKDGYYIFPQPLDEALINKLVHFANTQNCIPRIGTSKEPVKYNKEQPVSPVYDFTNQDLVEDPTVQSLLIDESIIAVAQQYLGPQPVLDLVTMWWSTANSPKTNLSQTAQLYHFDLDRIRFLKFFIYLSDVDTHNGPHCYIEGSNKTKPQSVLRDGRIMDEELMAVYPKESFKEITGKIGTILAVDTIGFHKGKPLEKGDRLLFQVEFATSMFGQNYSPVNRNSKLSQTFLNGVKRFERTFSGILSK